MKDNHGGGKENPFFARALREAAGSAWNTRVEPLLTPLKDPPQAPPGHDRYVLAQLVTQKPMSFVATRGASGQGGARRGP